MILRPLAVSGLALVAACPALAQESFDLGTITVESGQTGFAGETVDLSTGRLLKSGAPIAETPRSVSVVTAEDMRARAAGDVEEALSYTPGVAVGEYGLDDRSDWYTIRGFRPTTFHDGLPARYGFYNDAKPEPFLLDRVQVLRGPASGLYGNGEVGGVVNTESKTAANFTGDSLVQLSFTDPEGAELGVDVGGDLNAAGTLRYRFVGLARHATTQVDYSDDDAVALAPSITWAPSADTSVTLLYTHQKNHGSPLIQFASLYGSLRAAPNGRYLSDELFVGEPDFDRFDTRQDSVTLLAEHRFSETWSLSARARYTDAEAEYDHAWWDTGANLPTRYNDDGTIDRTFYEADNSLETLSLDAYATADWRAGGWDMQTMLGATYVDAEYDSDTGFGGETRPIDPFDPDYTGAPEIDIVDTPANTVEEKGLYVQNRATWNDRLHLDAGLRWGSIETGEAAGTFTDATVNADDDAVTANAAVLYRFENGLAPYLSYAESFRQEIVGADADGDAFEPTRGEQYEIGVKYQPPGTRDLYTVALWDLEKSNLTQSDLDNPGFQVQTGEASSRGVELSMHREFGDFGIDASATIQDTENVDGLTIATIPDRFGSLWGTWAPSSGSLDGLSAGLGIRFSGEKWDGTDTRRTPSTTLVDARLAYQWDRYEAALNVSNLENERHVTFCGTTECYFGAGREVTVSLAARF